MPKFLVTVATGIVCLGALAGLSGCANSTGGANSAPASATEITWTTFENGLQQAQSERKPMTLFFTASWCPGCRYMENEVFRNAGVIQAANRGVSTRIDVDSRQDLSKKYNISVIPAFVFLDSAGNVRHRVQGRNAGPDMAGHINYGLS